jgi:hypothetical protein
MYGDENGEFIRLIQRIKISEYVSRGEKRRGGRRIRTAKRNVAMLRANEVEAHSPLQYVLEA